MSKLSAGIARAVISPPPGIDLCGYAGRIPGNTGVHDDLHAKAIVLSDGKTKAAIVSLDLVGLVAEQVARIRKEVAAKTDIPGENMLIGTSHTHAGPASQTIRACGYADDAYVESMLNRVIDTVVEASKNLQPVKFGFGTAQSDIAINRRYRARDGSLQIGENNTGPVDHEVGIWYFTDEKDKPFATIFTYACHAVTMSGDNRMVSADWPGPAQRIIEENTGGQAMFLQGCCGNINPHGRGMFDVVEKNGLNVGEAVLGALSGITLTENAELDIASETVQLPLEPAVSVEEAERVVQESAEKLKEDIPLGERHIVQAYHDWAKIMISRGGKGADGTPFEIQRFSLCDAHLVGLPGEVFVDYALNLKKMRPNVTVPAYTNGNVGYVPTAYAFPEGGYEVDMVYKLYAEQQFKPDVEEVILSAAQHLLGKD